MQMRRNQKGFTLMELMVVIVIVAILAAVAVPLYINYVKDAQRSEAKGAIGAVITAEQTYFQANPSLGYTTDKGALNVDLTDVSHNWNINITAADQGGFTVTADGIDGTPTATLHVTCVYSRAAAPVWTES
jgi:prepilin-type N-terminal cleavage/methylation domain-containing protein